MELRDGVPGRCPLCEGAVEVERVRCQGCGMGLEGRFGLGWVGALSREQLAFVGVFLSARGKIKDVEQALGISYPTVVARLDEVVEAIERRAATLGAFGPPPRPLEVLEQLAAGTIDVHEAERQLLRSRR